jgi:hypothetical protein
LIVDGITIARGRRQTQMQYFVVMIDHGRRGREAIVDPEMTRREVISRVASGEYNAAEEADLQACRFDHVRDLRKHETA